MSMQRLQFIWRKFEENSKGKINERNNNEEKMNKLEYNVNVDIAVYLEKM